MNLKNEIKRAVSTLKKGGIILYPTDTVWGLGCDATNENALLKIYELKQRPKNKGFIVLMKDIEQLQSHTQYIPEKAINLISFYDKPVTIIYNNIKNLAPLVYYEDMSLAVRIPRNTFLHTLIQEFGKPISSTSANLSGKPTPSFYNEIDEKIVTSVDYVFNYQRDDQEAKTPSRIIKFDENDELIVIR
jgi:L-threonylcarbamoyladenylate synthase